MSIYRPDGVLPPLSGREAEIKRVVMQQKPVYGGTSNLDFMAIKSCAAVALHMHQPLIPASLGASLDQADIIGHLQYMSEHPAEGDNHNAAAFHSCYKRMGEIIPELIDQGFRPRVMLDYSGALFYGLQKQGLHDVIDSLQRITNEPKYQGAVEWLGTPWGHAVAPSTPPQDFYLHVTAWQHHFAAIFGMAALSRVRGFSLAEMALPNHPDVAYELLKTLIDCGFKWVMVQEHTVEDLNGRGVQWANCHLPHRLRATNSRGETCEIIAIIKTQGSDTKLVAQMQPWYEAAGLAPIKIGDHLIPPLVTQIGDGENGGVMMNEFPGKFKEVAALSSASATPLILVTEYLEHLDAMGVTIQDLPLLQPIHHHKIFSRWSGEGGRHSLAAVIAELQQETEHFHVEGGSWTNSISWTKGYENVLEPMLQVSAKFAEKMRDQKVATDSDSYQRALFYLMISQTSCYRYWGQGRWTDYAREICRRALVAL